MEMSCLRTWKQSKNETVLKQFLLTCYKKWIRIEDDNLLFALF